MLKNYLKIAFRNLFRYKTFSMINIVGLAIGMACSILIVLYVYDAYRYDRFHENADRIYRVTHEFTGQAEQRHIPYVAPSVGPALADEFPGVAQAVRLGVTAPVMLGYDETYIVPEGTETYYAAPNIFDVFTFSVASGNPAAALAEPYSIVLTETLARRFFAENDPVGKFLEFQVHGRERQALKVTGVLEDVPENSHLQFACLVSFATLEDIYRDNPAWNEQQVATYLMLNENAAPASVESQLDNFLLKLGGKALADASKLHLQPMLDIHLHSAGLDSDRAIRGNLQIIVLLLSVAVGVILIAGVNFMNLSTARAADRAREIGVRKSLGAAKIQLAVQFLGESVLLATIAMFLCLGLVELALPSYNAFTEKTLAISYAAAWPILLGFAVFIGLFSGAYPAFVLSIFQPVHALKGRSASEKSQKMKKLLVTLQFALAILLFISVGIVYRQLDYIQNKDLGFQKSQVLQTVIPSSSKSGNDLFKHELLRHAQILEVGRAVVRPLYDMKSNFPSTPTLAEIDGEISRRETALRKLEVGYDFLEVFDMRLLAGRSFSEAFATDATEGFILNETAVRAIGWGSPEEALGKALHYDGRDGNIIGVLADFHFESLHSSILPFVLVFNRFSPMVFIKIAPEATAATIAQIEQVWEKHSTSKEPFNYQFMDAYYSSFYAAETKLQTLLTNFAILAILITCLGVLGLTLFSVEQRKKEIGVRKVLGATAASVTALLSKDFVKLALAANILAWPVAWFLMRKWLENFAYRAEITWSVFAFAGALALLIALLTVSTQAIRAASANPVVSLRHE